MGSSWMGLNTGLRALQTAQAMLETAAHNTANASTPGYSRQRVRIQASAPYPFPTFNRSGLPGQVGTGVTVASIERIRDSFLDGQIRTQTALSGYWGTRRDELAKVESIFPEPGGSGLSSALGRFWNAWHDVAADPTSSAARSALIEEASTLALRFNRDAAQLAGVTAGTNVQLTESVNQVNDLAARIAALNNQIQGVVISGDHANDLEDQRDALLEQLNGYLPVISERQADGTVTVLVGGTDLVNHGFARTIAAVQDGNGNIVPTWSIGGTVSLGQGSMSALVSIRDVQLAGYRSQLDTLAAGIADAVNAVHMTGVDATGTAGLAFFTYTPGQGAASISVNAAIAADTRLVAASSAPNQPGDGTIAGQIADLRSALLFGTGSQSAADFYAGLIGRIGSDSRQGTEMASNQQLVVDHLTYRRESLSGVSLDEEAADMIRFQHAYQAAARVITTIDEMLDQLINRTGIVGR